MDPEDQIQQNCQVAEIEREEYELLKASIQRLYPIWNEFGINSDQTSQRARTVWSHLKNLIEDIVKEESDFLENVKGRIESYTKKIGDLGKVLKVKPTEVTGSLIKREELLRLELDKLTKLKHKRVKAYQDLKAIEVKYCQILNMEEHPLPSNTGVPTEEDLAELEQHINMLRDEKERRRKRFCTARKELTTILEITEYVPESSIELDIVSCKECVSLSNETFKALEEILNKAQRRKAELESEKKTLMDKLSVLWQRLKVDEGTKAEFLSKHADCRNSTIQSIKKELERCEQMKKDNIEKFIITIRQDLQELWNKCHVSECERQLFYQFTTTEMSDEVLEAHEVEVKKWENYYEDVKHILSKIEKRKELWDLMIIFENKATDPNRYKNRRGCLLQEEKERKRLQKDLPTLENNIFRDIEAYEVEKGSSFIYCGEGFRDFVTNQWAERINQKENEKIERHNKHLNQLTLGTPAKRPMKTTPKSAPSKLLKSTTGMSMFRTPVPSTSRVVPNTVSKLTMKSSRLFASKPANVPKKDLKKFVLRERNQALNNNPKSPDGTTYTDFVSELNATVRSNLRSSVLATKKPGGSRISQNSSRSKRKSAAKRKSMRNTSKMAQGLTPARGKLGLPFLI